MAIACEIMGESLKCATDAPKLHAQSVASVQRASESDNYDNCGLHNYGSELPFADGAKARALPPFAAERANNRRAD